MPENRSAEWLRGAVAALEEAHPDTCLESYKRYRVLLAEAEAREASVPTAANGAGTLTLSETIAGLREACAGVVVSKREVLTAEEVIEAAKKALEGWRDDVTDHGSGCSALGLCFGAGACDCDGLKPDERGDAALARIAAWEAARK